MKNHLLTRRNAHRLALRPLLCEQLERRYALHGMGWFESSTDRYEIAETTVYEDGSGFHYAELRSVSYGNRFSARPEPKISEGETVATDSSSNDSSATDELSSRHDCSRSRSGLGPGEGEAPRTTSNRSNNSLSGIDWFRSLPTSTESTAPTTAPTSSPVAGSSANPPTLNDMGRQPPPQAKVEDSRPFDGKPNNVAVSTNVSTPNSNKALDAALRAVVESMTRSVGNGPTIGSDAGMRSSFTGIFNLGSNADTSQAATSNRGESLIGSRNSSSLHTIDFNASPSVTSTLSTNAPEARSTASSISDALRSSSTSNLSSSSSNATISQRTSDVETNWQRSSGRTAATLNSAAQRETQGLLEQLRSVIDKIASERTADKNASERKLESSSSDRGLQQVAGVDKRMMPAADGMLELAVPTDRLSPLVRDAGDGSQFTNALPQHTQLFASLELNREFELAGPTVQSTHLSLIDTAGQTQRVNLVAKVMSEWNDQSSDSSPSDADRTVSEGSWWQQSLLPLSFLAISGLLIRSRKRYLSRTRPVA